MLLASRNNDGTVARFTELYSRVDAKWLQRSTPTAEEAMGLPPDWPPPMVSFEHTYPYRLASLLKTAATGDICGP